MSENLITGRDWTAIAADIAAHLHGGAAVSAAFDRAVVLAARDDLTDRDLIALAIHAGRLDETRNEYGRRAVVLAGGWADMADLLDGARDGIPTLYRPETPNGADRWAYRTRDAARDTIGYLARRVTDPEDRAAFYRACDQWLACQSDARPGKRPATFGGYAARGMTGRAAVAMRERADRALAAVVESGLTDAERTFLARMLSRAPHGTGSAARMVEPVTRPEVAPVVVTHADGTRTVRPVTPRERALIESPREADGLAPHPLALIGAPDAARGMRREDGQVRTGARPVSTRAKSRVGSTGPNVTAF